MIASFIRTFVAKLQLTCTLYRGIINRKIFLNRECRRFLVLVCDFFSENFPEFVNHPGNDDRIDCKGVSRINQCQQFLLGQKDIPAFQQSCNQP